jgi:hypothetical protein
MVFFDQFISVAPGGSSVKKTAATGVLASSPNPYNQHKPHQGTIQRESATEITTQVGA